MLKLVMARPPAVPRESKGCQLAPKRIQRITITPDSLSNQRGARGAGKRKVRSADKEAEHIMSHKVEIPKQPGKHMRPVSRETAPPDPEPSPVKAGPEKNLALAALDFGEPGKPGPDGVKVKLGGQGGKLRSFNTACFTSDKYRFTLVHAHKNGGSALADNIRRIICSHHNLDIDLKLSGHYKTCSLNLWRTGCQN